ncbi:MAG: hypothetical protein HZB26_13120 [Candidatus Hydrogenedentes bacterium]|nr:hypothetical protein [Candidatus Hydrogenedentota bacterium]
MMAPTVPLLLILCLVEVAAFVRHVFTGPSIASYLSRKPVVSSALLERTAVAAAMLCLLALVNREFLGEALLTKLPDGMTSSRPEVDIAVALNEVTAPTASLGVFKAGVSTYYTGRRGIDFLGKCDAHIASLPPDLTGSISYHGMLSVPGHNKYDLQYSIEQLGPTYVAGKQRGTDAMNAFVDQHYVLVDHKGVNLLLKKDSPDVLWDNVRPWDWRMGMARILGKSASMELTPEAETWAKTKDLLFESAFTTGLDGWKSSGGSWQAESGYLAGEGTIGRPNTLRDFEAILSYYFESVSDETSRALIQLMSNNAGYSLRLNVYPGKMILDQITETGYARLGTNLDVRADAGVWYTLYVRCDGAHVEIWRAPLNGEGEPVLTTDRRAEIANERLLLGGAKVAVRYDGVAVVSERRAEGT